MYCDVHPSGRRCAVLICQLAQTVGIAKAAMPGRMLRRVEKVKVCSFTTYLEYLPLGLTDEPLEFT